MREKKLDQRARFILLALELTFHDGWPSQDISSRQILQDRS